MDEASWEVRFLAVETAEDRWEDKVLVDAAWLERYDRSGNTLPVGIPLAAVRRAIQIQEVTPWRY